MHVNRPLSLSQVKLTDPFWQREQALVRGEVIPYQHDALLDRVEGAEPSWFMHNMRAAARAVAARKAGTFRPRPAKQGGIAFFPDAVAAPDPDAFYGFVFQDTDGYKWLEAVSYQLMLRPDPALEREAEELVRAVCAAQEEDGYLDTYFTLTGIEDAFSDLKDHHELYCFGHLTEAAVAWKQATGRDDLLNAARRYGDCITRRFGPGKERACPGHEIAEMALFRLYELTGEDKWKELALFFLDVRGTEPNTFALEDNRRREKQGLPPVSIASSSYVYWQADRPVRDTAEARGHAVRQMYLAAGMADAARLTGDQEMLSACERLWDSVTRRQMYVTGGVGATHQGEAFSRPYDLPSDAAYAETCAAIGLCFFARRMLELSPKAEYADVMEQALYNTVLSGMALDGKSFFYVNPLSVDPAACETDGRLAHVKPVRQKWFPCACCPPNAARLLSGLGAYTCTRTADTLYLHLLIGQEIRTELNGSPLTVAVEADLMKDGTVTLTVTEGEADGNICLRRPGWTDGAAVRCSWGGELPGAPDENGYLSFRRRWQKGDTLTVSFSMPVRVLAAHPAVQALSGQVCLCRGPFVFCAEEADMGPGLSLLRVDPAAAKAAEILETQIAGVRLPCLTLPAFRAVPAPDAPLYAPVSPAKPDPVQLKLIPYFAWANRGKGEMRVWLNRL